MSSWSDITNPWPIRRVTLKDLQASWLLSKKMERYRKPLIGEDFLRLFWKAAYQLKAEGIVCWKSKEAVMFTPEQEEKIKGLAYKRELAFALKALSKSGAYQTITAMNLSEKPFEPEMREKTIITIVSSIIQGYAVLYALGAMGQFPTVTDDILSKWTDPVRA